MDNSNSRGLHDRIHGLDSLRAAMMLLGIVVHASVNYVSQDIGWLIKDPLNTNLFFDILILFIHEFRMPVFFVLAGFFGAFLYYRKGSNLMLNNRLKRILIPFVVASIILWPFVAYSIVFTQNCINGNDQNFMTGAVALLKDNHHTWHLWFLYYLSFYSLLGWLMARLINKNKSIGLLIQSAFEKIHNNNILKYGILSGITYICYLYIDSAILFPSFSLIPDFPAIIFYSLFYFYGWMLFTSSHILNDITRNPWKLTGIAMVLYIIKLPVIDQYGNPVFSQFVTLINALMPWLFVFGFTGLALRYGNNPSKRIRYFSDASYWIYLVHLPLTILIPAIMVSLDMTSFLKNFIVIFLTSLICISSYHFFVRSTLIGKFLNGRQYKRPSNPVS